VRAVATSAELRVGVAAARQAGAAVGLVPTMGALHAGHRSLLAAARRENGFVVASIFVNPLQFGPNEDLASYPRDLAGDLAVMERDGVDLAFTPEPAEMWPQPPVVRVSAGEIGTRLEGALRPGHLDGVATVVAKLLNLVGPCRAYFGRKDAQQLAMVRRMVSDLAFPNEIVACPTIREPDGLALSSRNAYLSPEERRRATALSGGLRAGLDAWLAGERDPAKIEAAALAVLDDTPGIDTQYVALVEPEGFEPSRTAEAGHVLAVAARVGPARLIDNLVLEAPA
jgi:pantoate--beta-alanine ligase